MPILACTSLFLATASTQPVRIGLEGTWRLTQAERKIDIPASVPGVVHTDLMRAKLIPDPLYRSNDKAVQWVGQVPWTYARTFNISTEFAKRRKIVLRCEGLDTLSQVQINGKVVANPDNMFRTWEFDAKPFLRTGSNEIKISFQPIEPFLKAHEVQEKFPGKPVQSHGWGYVRKPPFQQGWDFSPRLITAGIWRKIGLIGWNEARLNDIEIVQDHKTKGEVGVAVHLSAEALGSVSARTQILYKGQVIGSSNTRFTGGKGAAQFRIKNPKLWWPNGMGLPNLYDVRVDLLDSKGKVVDQDDKRIGLRYIEWVSKTETRPLSVKINGRPFFAKGSNLVPPDALIVRTTPEQEKRLVQKAIDANMNMMRLWGGGYYENDSLFDAADEKGLLLWFEFKFADATYPVFDPEWLANVKAEAEDNVRRVRHHPCIAIYSGNNECIGFIADKTDPGHMSREDYQLLFHKTLKEVVNRLAPGEGYTPGSPEIGDEHDWDVWHGSAKFESYRGWHGFMSEYGFQAFPVPQSVVEFTKPEDRKSVVSDVMRNHQRNWRDGNQLIVSTLMRAYKQPKDFDSTLWLSQIQQSAGVLTGVEHWRRDWPKSSGSLVWQFNDCWPSISWSMMDVYERPKALYYNLKHAYAPVALSGLAKEDGTAELWVANDRLWAKSGRIAWTAYSVEGKVLSKGALPIVIPAGTSSVRAGSVDLRSVVAKSGFGNVLLWARLSTAGEPDSTTLLTFARPKYLNLARVAVSSSVTKVTGGYRVTLSSSKPALWSWVELHGLSYEVSDNFVHLMPGEIASILVKTSSSLAAVKKALRVQSLVDTYAPGTEADPVTFAQPNGEITATADLAEIVGDTAILEIGTPSNVGNWTQVKDGLKWRVRNSKPGRYKVTAVVGIPEVEKGSQFEVEIDGEKVSATVPGTKSWYDYTEIEMGEITIRKSGAITILLRPLTRVHDHVMNLRQVKFTRLD